MANALDNIVQILTGPGNGFKLHSTILSTTHDKQIAALKKDIAEKGYAQMNVNNDGFGDRACSTNLNSSGLHPSLKCYTGPYQPVDSDTNPKVTCVGYPLELSETRVIGQGSKGFFGIGKRLSQSTEEKRHYRLNQVLTDGSTDQAHLIAITQGMGLDEFGRDGTFYSLSAYLNKGSFGLVRTILEGQPGLIPQVFSRLFPNFSREVNLSSDGQAYIDIRDEPQDVRVLPKKDYRGSPGSSFFRLSCY